MAQQIINIGTNPDDKTGDTLRDGGDKINDNFTELYSAVADRGWANYSDSVYTSSNKLRSAAARTKVTIDGLGSTTTKDHLPAEVTDFWDTTNNVITAVSEGDAYDLRISFVAESTAANDWFDIELDIGGAVGVIANRTETFPKGIGVAHNFMWSLPVYVGGTFVSNGASIYINTSDSGDTVDLYDFRIMIKRDYAGS